MYGNEKSNRQIWANLATIDFLENNSELGIIQLKKAIELKGGPIDFDNFEEVPHLHYSLEGVGCKY